jgi:hypothetical protein
LAETAGDGAVPAAVVADAGAHATVGTRAIAANVNSERCIAFSSR